jgi:hypothetical protein
MKSNSLTSKSPALLGSDRLRCLYFVIALHLDLRPQLPAETLNPMFFGAGQRGNLRLRAHGAFVEQQRHPR